MTRTEELLALAEAATKGPHRLAIPQPLVDLADRDFQRACTPETIKQLVELVRLQHEALKEYTGVCRSHNDPNDFTPRVIDEGFHARNAIAAFNKFDGGE